MYAIRCKVYFYYKLLIIEHTYYVTLTLSGINYPEKYCLKKSDKKAYTYP